MNEKRWELFQKDLGYEGWVEVETELGKIDSDTIRAIMVEKGNVRIEDVFINNMLPEGKVIVSSGVTHFPHEVYNTVGVELAHTDNIDPDDFKISKRDTPSDHIKPKVENRFMKD